MWLNHWTTPQVKKHAATALSAFGIEGTVRSSLSFFGKALDRGRDAFGFKWAA